MKTTKLYSRNKEVLNKTIKCLKDKKIVGFKTQSQLYCFIEDIKNPFLKNGYHRRNYPKTPAYVPVNYEPIINRLLEMEILERSQSETGRRTVTYNVCRINLHKAANTLASE